MSWWEWLIALLDRELRVALWCFIVVGASIAALISGQWWASRKVGRWARDQRCGLIEWRGVPSWSSPRGWFRTDNQDHRNR
jgi:hypothetical protein